MSEKWKYSTFMFFIYNNRNQDYELEGELNTREAINEDCYSRATLGMQQEAMESI